MPIYEYACGSCGHRFETKQRFSDDPITTCPECGQSVRRVLHPAGIIFKGSGFYINDSRNVDKSVAATSTPASSNGAESAPTAEVGTKSENGSKADKPDTKVAPTSSTKTESD